MLEVINSTVAYHVSYRIKDEDTPQGTSQERYDDLVGRLEKMKPVFRSGHFEDEAHTATSSWIVRLTEKSAEALGAKLAKKLTPGIDLLEVVEVALGNRFEFTRDKPKLKSMMR
jgi:hypothetical protein